MSICRCNKLTLFSFRLPPRINVSADGSVKVDSSQPSSGVKRAESFGPSSLSMNDPSRLKRNPSFTTRKRTSSLRKVKRMDNPEDLPPLEMAGFLDRKHEQQSGGKRAAIRSWKTYYTGTLHNIIIQTLYLL